MTDSSDRIQYFLGIAGEQTGPYTKAEVLEKVQRHEIPPDALLWYEGQSFWQPIVSIEDFREAYKQSEPTTQAKSVWSEEELKAYSGAEQITPPFPTVTPLKSPPTPKPKPLKNAAPADFESEPEDLETVFESSGGGGGSFLGGRAKIFGFTLLLFIAGGGGYFYWQSQSQEAPDNPTEPAKKIALPKNAAVPAKAPAVPDSVRQANLKKLEGDILLNPQEAIHGLQELAKQNPDDEYGKRAIATIVEYYKQTQRFAEAGKLLLDVHQPLAASEFLLKDKATLADAETALFTAYQQTKDPGRREILIKDIDLLIGPLAKEPLAIERITLLSHDFPNSPQPYAYYLKTKEEKITDLFQRLSFYLVQNLIDHMTTEFPRMNLSERPVVQVMKDKTGNYRIIGKYKGDVVLNRDRLPAITFVYWLYNDTWALVETNVTPERAKWTVQERKRRENEIYTVDSMLEFLQSVFHQRFPKIELHRPINERTLSETTKVPTE